MDASTLLKYRQIAKLARETDNPGERAAAESALRGMESKFPGILSELAQEEARAKKIAREEALRKAGLNIPDLDIDFGSGWFDKLAQRLVKKATNWAIEKLAEDLPPLSHLDLEEIMARAKKTSTPSLEENLVAWDKSKCLGIELEGDFFSEEPEAVVMFDLTITPELWHQIRQEPGTFIEFLDGIMREDASEEGYDSEDEDEEEDDE
jgi:hypothetical protein